MRRILSGLILAAAACTRAQAPSSPAPSSPPPGPPSSIVAMERVRPGTVAGYVTDQAGRALAEGLVMLDTTTRAMTDSAGRFRFDGVSPGTHTLRVRHIGFDQALQLFALDSGSGTALAVRLRVSPFQLTEVCLTYMAPSIIVRVRDIRGTNIAIAHGDSVARYSLDLLHDVADGSGTRSVSAFYEEVGRFYITVTAPGYRDWETNVFVRPNGCHVGTQVVNADLRR